jgi:PRTRC genetic system protein B
MNITVHSNELHYSLETAVLIYRSKTSSAPFITLHSVQPPVTPGTLPQLGAARPIDRRFVRSLSRSLSPRKAAVELLPDNVLACTDDTLLWWSPATRRPLYFEVAEREDQETLADIDSRPMAHPPLVFMVDPSGLTVRALPTNERPTAETPLMIAPYWNVYSHGGVCLGSMKHPRTLSVSAIRGWEDGFFDSKFSHPNTPLLTRFKSGIVALWKTLADNNESYPLEMLVPAKQTLAALLR